MKVQRLRLRLALDETAAEISYRDLVIGLEHACEAAGLELSRSEGKRSAPQISLGAPLPQGVTSDCEFVDLYLSERIDAADAIARLSTVLPSGVNLIALEEIGLNAPSLSSSLRWSEYEVTVGGPANLISSLQQSIDRLLAANSLPSEYRRESRVRQYDLRPLIYDLRLKTTGDHAAVLTMRLCAEQDKTARADQVLLALGLPDSLRIHRRRLYLEANDAAVLAHRLQGELTEV